MILCRFVASGASMICALTLRSCPALLDLHFLTPGAPRGRLLLVPAVFCVRS